MTDTNFKVMHVIGAKTSGGAELFYLRLVKALAQKVNILCVVREGSWMENQLKSCGLTYKTVPFGGCFDFKTKKLLEKYIEEFQPNVIQGWMNRACSRLPETSVPTVGRLGGFYDLKNYKNCDYLVGNTKDIQEYVIEKGHDSEKSFYIPNFAPVPDLKFKLNRADVRLEYKIPEDAKVLFVAGRLHHVKGIDLAILALRSLSENVHLMVAGNGKLYDQLLRLAQKEGVEKRVHFIGWVNTITVVASAVDIWLVPSRHEPLGNVVLDAWAHQIPVVASETHGPKSLIENDITGLLFPIEDVDTMVRHIENLLKSPDKMAAIAQKAVCILEANYSEEIVVQKYINFYEKIAL